MNSVVDKVMHWMHKTYLVFDKDLPLSNYSVSMLLMIQECLLNRSSLLLKTKKEQFPIYIYNKRFLHKIIVFINTH
jgi:hypothetical protein